MGASFRKGLDIPEERPWLKKRKEQNSRITWKARQKFLWARARLLRVQRVLRKKNRKNSFLEPFLLANPIIPCSGKCKH